MNKDEIRLQKTVNEFKYSEDAQMALNDALYANDFSLDNVKKKAIDGTLTLLFIPVLAVSAPANQAFAKSDVPKVQLEQQDYGFVTDVIEETEDPIITNAEVVERSPYEDVLLFLKNLKTLPKDLRRFDFEVPSEAIIDNAQKFLVAMRDVGLPCPEEGNVIPSVFGTIVIDVMVERGLVSMEIGRTKIGFFTDYEDGINEESDGIATSFTTIPEPLLRHLIS